jgi:preprotein translocase subunit SecY
VGKGLFWYFYGALIFVFTYFYSTIVLSPKDLAENFQKNSVIITNMLPGKQTENYLTHSLAGIARVNAFFLLALILGVQLSSSLFHLNLSNIRGVGFTSQIILVNVLIDTLEKARGFLIEEQNSLNHEE